MINILLVDDDPRWLEDMAWAARGRDRTFVQALSEEEAIQKINENDFDVVVTDLELRQGEQDTGGLAILEAAKAKDIYTQVIVCTAKGTPAISVRAMKMGAFDYLERNPAGTDHLSMLQSKIFKALEFRDSKLNQGKAQ
jgi:DNA-binding NtrC family response regulator